VDLVLTGPYKGISAYGCFAISIDIPTPAAGSSGDPIQWEWDCYDPKYATQVDKPPVSHTIGDVAEVTYAGMSNAWEATVQQVRLRLKDGHRHGGISGEHYVENDFWERLAFSFLRAAEVGAAPTVACSGPAGQPLLQIHSRGGRCLSRPYKCPPYITQ
jgi:hypothetical protein